MRNKSPANSAASSPLVPARTSTITFNSSALSFGSKRTSNADSISGNFSSSAGNPAPPARPFPHHHRQSRRANLPPQKARAIVTNTPPAGQLGIFFRQFDKTLGGNSLFISSCNASARAKMASSRSTGNMANFLIAFAPPFRPLCFPPPRPNGRPFRHAAFYGRADRPDRPCPLRCRHR